MEGIKKWAVYTIRSRAGLEKPIWVRVGIAFLNRDGSFNLHLDATPLDGKLHMREWREEATPGADATSRGHDMGSNGMAAPASNSADMPF